MPHEVKNNGVSPGIGNLENGGISHPQGKNSAPISKPQLVRIIQNLNQNVVNIPSQKTGNTKNVQYDQSEHTPQITGEKLPQNIETQTNKGKGNENGRGHNKEIEINPRSQNNSGHQPKLIDQTPNVIQGLPIQQEHLSTEPLAQNINQTVNILFEKPSPPPISNPLSNQIPEGKTDHLQMDFGKTQNKSQYPNNSHNTVFADHGNGHQKQKNDQNNLVIKLVFQNKDIYLSSKDVQKLTALQNFQSQNSLPPEIKNLIQNINEQTSAFLENTAKFTGKTANQIATELSQQFNKQVQIVKGSLLQNTDLNAKSFKQTNIQEKMQIAVELMPKHLSNEEAVNLHKYSTEDILKGLLLTRGILVAEEKSPNIKNLINFIPTIPQILPDKMDLSAIRDVGFIVKVLIADAAIAKNTFGLDLSVQKFIRLLIANNELGVLLATINLACDAGSQRVLVNRAIALVKIYELINRLIQAGEKAMKATVVNSMERNILQNTEQKAKFVNLQIATEIDEKSLQNSKIYPTGAETSLRQFLEFNPNYALDNSISAFFNTDDSHPSMQDFSTIYHQDIENWLKSGDHRFVKDYVFEKPVGIIVERNTDGFFNASKVRIILVRDGSVQGWHVLKSVLVR